MARQLEDLVGVKLSDMSMQEKLAFLQNLRRSRRTPKATSKVVKSRKRQKKKDVDKLDDFFTNLSPQDKKKFLEGKG